MLNVGEKIKDISKFHVKIGGMSCSFCVETIKKAYGKQKGVENVNVSLSHEELLISYDPSKISRGELEKTLTDLGYTIADPRKVKAFEEQEKELRLARKRLFIAGTFTLISLILMILMWSGIRSWWFRWAMLSLALATMFGPGWPIKKKAWQSLKRGILNQHILLELGAFSGSIGGFTGFFMPGFPIADFFAVSVFVTSYHLLSGWVSLLVRTRASQAVQKLLDLQPKTAKVIQNGKEVVKKIEELKINDIVRVRPGERIPIDGITIKGYSTVDESIVTGESIPLEKGILMRSGEAFQTLPQIKKMVLDKTGTITKGKPEVVEIVNYDFNKKKILSLVGSAERLSEHPLAQAIIKYIDEEKVSYAEPKEFNSFSGKGVKAKVGQDTVIVGKTSFLEEKEIKLSKHQLSKIEEMAEEGKTAVGIGVNKELMGIIGLGIPAAATGLLHPVWAMIAMAASVGTVLLNSFGIPVISQAKRKLNIL
ncbi:MAG TPA: cation-translocating P-type ATPase [Candidatus Scalindua sp.]|nr:cation-translocating P-type ATPase [Candidatus Scalindua sp.]